jgi:peptide/nickel transport system permease protein
MLRFLANKIVRLMVLLGAVSLLTFTLLELSPIDPVSAYVGAEIMRIGPEQRELIAQRWGLDEPPVTRFAKWAGQALQGNLGTSMIYNLPVSEVIGQRFLASLGLMVSAWLISGILGFVLGVVAGAYEGSWWDQAIRFYAYTLASTPTFWIALLLLIIFSVSLKVTPICCAAPPGVLPDEVTWLQRIHHLILPTAALSIIGVAGMTMHTRQKLLEVMQSDYALFARARGESTWGIVRHHGLRNIALPAITLQFSSLSELFGGAVLAEQVFTYPGLGEAAVQAGVRGDVPLLLGVVFFSAIFVFTGNTLADIAYHLIDPRIRLAKA